MSNGARGASRVSAGALRVGVDVSIANVLVYFATQVVPPDILADAENLIIILVSAGFGALGKYLRDRGVDWIPF
jgi:hypothetical protein